MMKDDGKTRIPSGKQTDNVSKDEWVTQIGGTPVVGQLEIIEGPGTGKRLPFHAGTNALGRDPKTNLLVVDFGDAMIGRNQHALLICDAAKRTFSIQANGHPNPILLNGATVTARAPLAEGDQIKIGQTTFKFLG